MAADEKELATAIKAKAAELNQLFKEACAMGLNLEVDWSYQISMVQGKSHELTVKVLKEI
jgi:hypothetical protein